MTKTSARHGLLGFAWLGTATLLTVAALEINAPDPQLLQPIERQPSYNAWIPGPHAGRYYVLDPVTGTLILVGLGALASAAPIMRRAMPNTPPATPGRPTQIHAPENAVGRGAVPDEHKPEDPVGHAGPTYAKP
ncbi:MAG: hypothetical protein FKY71_19140 [Spiribacter salinus]|uniref:Uncharacterized protein n=1 Tax=Spiribacter salinus TaxID=1335746 RepID=A0A540V9F1_9GAMM|nr:MAG: hypothetical protein FKY71_19140 [Spiribacter salinus]